MIDFDVSKPEARKLHAIALRAVGMAHAAGIDYTLMDAEMDLTATHCNGMPLDLDKLAGFDEFNFAHDVFGIRRHIDRESGTLQNCFVPRACAKRRALV